MSNTQVAFAPTVQGISDDCQSLHRIANVVTDMLVVHKNILAPYILPDGKGVVVVTSSLAAGISFEWSFGPLTVRSLQSTHKSLS